MDPVLLSIFDMEREEQAQMLADHVKGNDVTQVEMCLENGDSLVWREIIRYELPLATLYRTLLKDNPLIPKLTSCEIVSISSFHLAAMLGHNDVIVNFLDKEIPVDLPLSTGTTALQLASIAGRLDTARLLVNIYSAQVNRQDGYGWTALHYACIEGHLPVVEFLMEQGGDPTIRDKDGTSAPFRAQINGHEQLVAFMCQAARDENGDLLDISIDDDTIPQQVTADMYAKVKKPGSGERKHSAPVLPIHLPGVQQRKTSLDTVVPLTQKTTRQVSEPTHQTPPSGTRKIPVKAMTLPGRGKEMRNREIRRLVRNEIEAAFSDYETPTGMGGQRGEDGDIGNVFSSLHGAGMGVNTLKGIMRQELDKYRKEMFSDEYNNNGSPSRGGTMPRGGSHHSNQHESPQPMVRLEVTEEDPYATLTEFSLAPSIPFTTAPAPPLPPRNMNSESQKPNETIQNMEQHLSGMRLSASSTSEALSESVRKLGPILGSQWKQLAHALPLEANTLRTQQRIREIEQAHPGDVSKQAGVALVEWRINAGRYADVDQLILALRKCKMDAMIPIVERITQEFTA